MNFRTENHIKKILYKKNDNCATINKLNVDLYFNKFDNIKNCCTCFKDFKSLYSIKYNYKRTRKYYFSFIHHFNGKITVKTVKEELDKLYNIWQYTINYNNKYYLKFLRRIGYNLINNLYLFISSDDIDEDALEFINNINNKKIEDYEEKKIFYDFINLYYIKNI